MRYKMQCDVCKHHFRITIIFFFNCIPLIIIHFRGKDERKKNNRKSEKAEARIAWHEWVGETMTKRKKETNTHNSCLIVSFHTGILFIIPVILALSQSYSRLHINMCIYVLHVSFIWNLYLLKERAHNSLDRDSKSD